MILFLNQSQKKLMRHLLFLILCSVSCFVANSQDSIPNSPIPQLGVPFGTIVKLHVRVVDGDSLQRKQYEGVFLLSILSVNDSILIEPLLLTFSDESGKLANDNFHLFQLRQGKRVKSLTSEQIKLLKKGYVDKKYTVIATRRASLMDYPRVMSAISR